MTCEDCQRECKEDKYNSSPYSEATFCPNFLPKEKQDVINHPSHYMIGKYEAIDIIEEAIKANKLDGVQGYLYGSALAYLLRFNNKGKAWDLKKLGWYIDRLIKEMEK